MSMSVSYAPDKDKPQNWYFTFGCGQPNAGRYIVLFGTFGEAREEIYRRYETKWSMQYTEGEFGNQAVEYGLTPII